MKIIHIEVRNNNIYLGVLKLGKVYVLDGIYQDYLSRLVSMGAAIGLRTAELVFLLH